jgi:hypothetical protein
MVVKTLILTLVLFMGCGNNNPISKNEPCECDINIYTNLPKQNEIYELTFNDSYVQTFTQLYVETECGLHTKVSWDTNYQYRINTDWVSLVNPSSMTDEDGDGIIIFGVWEEFIGDTISVYCGYTDDCGNHHLDSIKIFIQ